MPMIKDPRWAAINFDGTPAAGAQLFVYANGTSNLVQTYADSTLSTPNTTPLIADGRGYFPTFFAPEGTYKIVIQSDSGAPISEVSDVVC